MKIWLVYDENDSYNAPMSYFKAFDSLEKASTEVKRLVRDPKVPTMRAWEICELEVE